MVAVIAVEKNNNIRLFRFRGNVCHARETSVAVTPQRLIDDRCPVCGGLLRPNVVLFGERLPARQLATYKDETRRGFDLVISIGTTSVFPYIAGPVLDAYHFRKPSVEINPCKTDVTEFVTVKIPYRAAPALEEIWRVFNS